MTPREIIDEWLKGCACAGPASGSSRYPNPADCEECTEAMKTALIKAVVRELIARAVDKVLRQEGVVARPHDAGCGYQSNLKCDCSRRNQ